ITQLLPGAARRSQSPGTSKPPLLRHPFVAPKTPHHPNSLQLPIPVDDPSTSRGQLCRGSAPPTPPLRPSASELPHKSAAALVSGNLVPLGIPAPAWHHLSWACDADLVLPRWVPTDPQHPHRPHGPEPGPDTDPSLLEPDSGGKGAMVDGSSGLNACENELIQRKEMNKVTILVVQKIKMIKNQSPT
ncbi:hypothetical protein ILYODFUR_008999, partial [Ilyodon furcidens]